MSADDISEEHPGIRQQQPGTPSGAAQPDAVTLDDEWLQARGGTRVGGGAAGQSTANDDDVGGMLAAKPWVIGTPFGGEGVDPGREAVTCTHENAKCKMHRHFAFCILHYFSLASSLFFLSTPQRYPVRPPSLPTTRWQGMTRQTGLVAQARATARTADGAPMSRATWLYARVWP